MPDKTKTWTDCLRADHHLTDIGDGWVFNSRTLQPERKAPPAPPAPPPPPASDAPPPPPRKQKTLKAEFATLTDRNGQPIPDGMIVDPKGDFDLEVRDYRGAKPDDPRILHFPGLNLDMPRAVRIAWRDWYFDSPDDFDPVFVRREAVVTVTRDRVVFGSFADLPLRPRGFCQAVFAAIRRIEPWFLFTPAPRATGSSAQ
jgi:hypothetical protein